MTTGVDEVQPAAPTSPAAPRRRRRLRLCIAALVALIVAAGLGWSAYGIHYQPLGPPPGYRAEGPVTRDTIGLFTDGLGSRTYAVLGGPGTSGTVQYSLSNNGPFDVRLLGPDSVTAVWATYRWAPADLLEGTPQLEDSRPFPVTLRSHQAIQLFVTITPPPTCGDSTYLVLGIGMRWTAMGFQHVSAAIRMSADGDPYSRIALCYPKSALKHLERITDGEVTP